MRKPERKAPASGRRHSSPQKRRRPRIGARVVITDLRPCHGCGTPTHIDLLDAKDDGTGDFTILECRKCYGPGWAPFLARQVRYHYKCPDCGHRWRDIWSVRADDADCPECGKRRISPVHSEDVP